MPTPESQDPLRFRDVRRRFDRAAAQFDGSDFVHRHTADGLMERMQPMQLEVKRILDLGSASGAASRSLATAFRRSHVVSLDVSAAMLRTARRRRSRFSRLSELQADARRLPLRTGSIDLVFANLLLPWIGDPAIVFGEIARVLRVGGAVVFSTLGPDSLLGLRQAWSDADRYAHVNPFLDMHEIGDAMVRAGLSDPVIDVDRLDIRYSDSGSLFRDLTAAGARNALRGRNPGMTGRARFDRMIESLGEPAGGEGLTVGLEIVYGHAWGSGPPQRPGEYRFDASRISRRHG